MIKAVPAVATSQRNVLTATSAPVQAVRRNAPQRDAAKMSSAAAQSASSSASAISASSPQVQQRRVQPESAPLQVVRCACSRGKNCDNNKKLRSSCMGSGANFVGCCFLAVSKPRLGFFGRNTPAIGMSPLQKLPFKGKPSSNRPLGGFQGSQKRLPLLA